MLRRVLKETDHAVVRVCDEVEYRTEEYWALRRRVVFPSSVLYGALGVGFSGPVHAVPHVLHALFPAQCKPDARVVKETDAMRHGTETEAVALRAFAAHLPLFCPGATMKVPQSPPMYTRGLHRSGAMLFGATPDGLLTLADGTQVGVEIKCPYHHGEPWDVPNIPPRVIVQCYGNMYVLGTKRHYLVCFVAPHAKAESRRCVMAVYVIYWEREVWKRMIKLLERYFTPLMEGERGRFAVNGQTLWDQMGLPRNAGALVLEREFS